MHPANPYFKAHCRELALIAESKKAPDGQPKVGTKVQHQGWTWNVANYFTHNGRRYMRLWSKQHHIATNVEVGA